MRIVYNLILVDDDCGDGSDEANCAYSCDNQTQFQCRVSLRCIDKGLVCDGVNHCDDGSDEAPIQNCCKWSHIIIMFLQGKGLITIQLYSIRSTVTVTNLSLLYEVILPCNYMYDTYYAPSGNKHFPMSNSPWYFHSSWFCRSLCVQKLRSIIFCISLYYVSYSYWYMYVQSTWVV